MLAVVWSSGWLLSANRLKTSIDDMKKFALSIFLLIMVATGCSVVSNSEQFYQDRPPRRINWHEYTSN
jgi:hypothetical protein